jgi:hypothetical protein
MILVFALVGGLLYFNYRAPDENTPEVSPAEPKGQLQGAVLPGDQLVSQIVPDRSIGYTPMDPLEPRYPAAQRHGIIPTWQNIASLDPRTLVHADRADARFNDEDAKYQIAFHDSYYGGMPASAGDFNGDGVEDFINMSHYAYVDGHQRAGEVNVYFGRRGAGIDPRTHPPDVVFYGDQSGAKLGISVASAGDFNGDGRDDLAIAAAFYNNDADGRAIAAGGRVYVIFGGSLDLSPKVTKVRIEDVGRKLPGLVLEGGHDGSHYLAWADSLEAGDFNGDGISDLIVGAYNPYQGTCLNAHNFAARAYLVYGSRAIPTRMTGFRLGVDVIRDGIRTAVFEAPNCQMTNVSLGFGAYFVGDIDSDGFNDLAFATNAGGAGRGAIYFFFGRSDYLSFGPHQFADADLIIAAEDEPLHGLVHGQAVDMKFQGLDSARPAGDVNGDGILDLLIGAHYSQRLLHGAWTTVGAAGIFYGRHGFRGNHSFSSADVFVIGERRGNVGHPAVERNGDIDGDGYSDLLINDPYYIESIGGDAQYRGRLWVIRGAKDLPRFLEVEKDAALTFLPDTTIPGMFGYTWSTGDWNGDGRLDIVIGDHYAGDSVRDEHRGVTYMYYNGSSF